MHQVKKGNQYHFGMKLHIGVDAETGLVHSLTTTPANVHGVTEAHRLLHGGELQVWGDAGYMGVQKREENLESAVDWQVAMRPGQRRKLGTGDLGQPWRKRSRPPLGPRWNTHSWKSMDTSTTPWTLRLHQGTLSGSGQEHGTVGPAAGPVQLEDSPTLPGGRLTQGVVGPTAGQTGKGADTGCKRA